MIMILMPIYVSKIHLIQKPKLRLLCQTQRQHFNAQTIGLHSMGAATNYLILLKPGKLLKIFVKEKEGSSHLFILRRRIHFCNRLPQVRVFGLAVIQITKEIGYGLMDQSLTTSIVMMQTQAAFTKVTATIILGGHQPFVIPTIIKHLFVSFSNIILKKYNKKFKKKKKKKKKTKK